MRLLTVFEFWTLVRTVFYEYIAHVIRKFTIPLYNVNYWLNSNCLEETFIHVFSFSEEMTALVRII